MKSASLNNKEISNLPFKKVVIAEHLKVIKTRSSRSVLVTTFILTLIMFAISLIRFKTDMMWYRPFQGISSPVSTLLAIVFILLITDEYSKGTGLITYILIPQREKVIKAKLTVCVIYTLLGLVMNLILTLISVLISSRLYGFNITWTTNLVDLITLVMPTLVNVFFGFAIALLCQENTVALGMFILIPPVTVVATQIPAIGVYAKWISLEHASSIFIAGQTSVTQLQIMTSIFFWIVLPFLYGNKKNKTYDFS